MQRVPFRSLAVLLALGGATACSADRVVGSEAGTPVNRPATPAGPWTPSFPTVPSGALVFDRVSSSSFEGRQRFVLFTNGTFSLQFVRESEAAPAGRPGAQAKQKANESEEQSHQFGTTSDNHQLLDADRVHGKQTSCQKGRQLAAGTQV